MQTDLKKYNNKWYKAGSILKRAVWFCINEFFFKTAILPFSSPKVLLLKAFGAKMGKRIKIKPCVNIKYPWFLEIDNDVWIGEMVWIDNLALVKIGKNVCLSQGVLLLTGNHNFKSSTFDLIIQKIILEDGVWLGAKSIVCPGVVCKSHSVLSVGSIATSNLEAYSIYKGNPALKIKDRIIQ